MRLTCVLLICALFVMDIECSRSNGRKLKVIDSSTPGSTIQLTTTSPSDGLASTKEFSTTTPGVARHSRKHRRLETDDGAIGTAAAAPVEKTQLAPSRRRQYPEINGTGCAEMLCGPSELCVSKPPGNRAVCMSSKLARGHSRVARGRGKMRDLDKKPTAPTVEPIRNFQDRVKQAKAQANEYESQREKKQKKRLQSMIVTSPKSPSSSSSSDGSQNDVTNKAPAECRRRDLDVVGEVLLDSFKQQQDEHNSKHKKEKRNSTKKELHEDDECICQAPVTWEFQQLDADSDGKLSDRETGSLKKSGVVANVSDNCLYMFFKACDHNGDEALSEKEWCCCFADVLPPCLAAQNMVPSILIRGQPSVVPGAFVPQCDDDGFYHTTQCDANSGQCWCVDRNGHRLDSTSTSGSLNC